ncbi:MAG: hypothetical protein IKF19_01770 [Bacilli bacterium]|nr:hypothetical protein [Bacilli bacterium]
MVDNYKQGKIKELYNNGNYKEIALFVEPNFRIGNIVSEYNELTEAEKIITAISYNIYRKDNPLVEKIWNYQQVVNLDAEMFHLAKLDKGLKELFDSGNDYFRKNINEFIDINFLGGCNEVSIILLYNRGYKSFITDNVLNYNINSFCLIESLLSIKEFRDKIITKKFLLHGFNSRHDNYFLMLPDDRKYLLGLYGSDIFGNDNYGLETYHRFKKNLEELYRKIFPNFDKSLIEELINLYGNVSYDTVCFVINNTISNDKYLDEMHIIADKYFNGRMGVVLSFCNKYPDISTKIFKLDMVDRRIIEKIYELSVGDVLAGVNLLSVEDFLKCDIREFSYSFEENNYVNDCFSVSPVNFKTQFSLYSYYREIAKIDNKGNWEEYLVKSTHDDTLKEIYLSDKEGIDLLYEVNLNGDIVFVMENAGLIVWLPPVLTSLQINKLLEQFNSLKNKGAVDIFLGIANPNVNSNYIYLNNGIPVNVEMAIDSVKRIRVKDKIKIKKNNY